MNFVTVTRILNGVLMIALPIVLGWIIRRRTGARWRIWWVGVLTMVLAQMGHIPFNMLLTLLFRQEVLPAPPQAWQLPFNAVVLGLSAGLWESWFRYIAYRWWAKDARSWGSGLMLGAGHGGIEAIVLGVLVLYALVQVMILTGMGDNIATLIPAEQLALVREQLAAYWSAPWYMTLLGALERVFALSLHLTASVMVLQAFLGRGIKWVWLAVAWHAFVDGLTVLLLPKGELVVEGVLAVLMVVNIGLLIWLRRMTPDDAPPPAAPPSEATLLDVERILSDLPDAPADIDQTRYNDDR